MVCERGYSRSNQLSRFWHMLSDGFSSILDRMARRASVPSHTARNPPYFLGQALDTHNKHTLIHQSFPNRLVATQSDSVPTSLVALVLRRIPPNPPVPSHIHNTHLQTPVSLAHRRAEPVRSQERSSRAQSNTVLLDDLAAPLPAANNSSGSQGVSTGMPESPAAVAQAPKEHIITLHVRPGVRKFTNYLIVVGQMAMSLLVVLTVIVTDGMTNPGASLQFPAHSQNAQMLWVIFLTFLSALFMQPLTNTVSDELRWALSREQSGIEYPAWLVLNPATSVIGLIQFLRVPHVITRIQNWLKSASSHRFQCCRAFLRWPTRPVSIGNKFKDAIRSFVMITVDKSIRILRWQNAFKALAWQR